MAWIFCLIWRWIHIIKIPLHSQWYLYKVQNCAQSQTLIHGYEWKYKLRLTKSNHSLKIWTNQRKSQLKFKIQTSPCRMNVVPVEYRGCLSPKSFKSTYVENSMEYQYSKFLLEIQIFLGIYPPSMDLTIIDFITLKWRARYSNLSGQDKNLPGSIVSS